MRILLTAAAAISAATIWMAAARRHDTKTPPRIAITPTTLFADGYQSAVLDILSSSSGEPSIDVSENPRAVKIEDTRGAAGHWRTRIRAGVLGGRVRIRVRFPGAPAATAEMTTIADLRDTAGDGTPDFLRLDDDHDRQSFRRWFTYLAEAQYFQPAASRPAEINDCAALIRYAYREALAAHDEIWSATARLPLIPAYDSIGKYQYPYTPVAAGLFRVRPGRFTEADLSGNTFAQFADAQTLWRWNTWFRSRDIRAAAPGDLLFFRQPQAREPFHTMLYLGESLIRPDGNRYILYHTGPDGADPGEMRRLTVDELLNFAQPQWRPLASNSSFLGVYRWNILKEGSK